MSTWELFIIAIGLSMDAFAVAVCKGLSCKKLKKRDMAITGAYFGIFQGVMPLLGFFAAKSFSQYIVKFDHWIAFVLLCIIGMNMVKESRNESCSTNSSFQCRAMLPLAIATSIDALIVGVTFAFLQVEIVPAVCFIASITFVCSVLGVGLGKYVGEKLKAKAELFGGLVLICMGIKIIVEHLFM